MKTTEEKNRMIAEFMGFKLQTNQEERWFNQWFTTPNGVWANRIEILHFDTSWDWLVPVVEKIEGLGNTVETRNNVFDTNFSVSIDGYYVGGYPRRQITTLSTQKEVISRITAIYQAVVQFIEWYNEQ